jgi:mannose-6-phosphate isomerase-like protein (cupin superfamily)
MKPQIRLARQATEFYTPERCWILEVANDESDGAASIARARVPPGMTTAWHVLDGVDERYIIISGGGHVELEPGPTADVGPGDVVLLPAGVAQRIRNTGDDDLVFFCVCVPRFTPACYRSLEPVT